MNIRGWVYVISNPAIVGLVKIGFSTKDPSLRARELDSAGFPHAFKVEVDFLVDNPRDVEQLTHKHLASYREGKEWFRCDIATAIRAIKNCATIIHASSGENLQTSDKSGCINSPPAVKKMILTPLRYCKLCNGLLSVKPWRKLYCWKCMGLKSTLDLISRNKEWCDSQSIKQFYNPEAQDHSDPPYNINRRRGEMGHCEKCGNPLKVISDGVVESCSYCASGKFSDYQTWAKTPVK
ncbi:GIY-YIG nuclease family protein [Limnohabitans sp.]|uniref:GIY-YIG nuclease family protein n=1 Tax=Limnohabitans sp. TaxID=1907725 RepID=UPI0025BDF61F|nr:GIY-YIG nuclease family protein [Limnohabitans sp.]